jgi:hypothetical protein
MASMASMASVKLYPEILPLADTSDNLVSSQLSKARANEILNKRKDFEKALLHYRKLRKKWKKANTILHGLGIGVGSTLAIAGAVTGAMLSAGTALPVLVPVLLAGAGTVEGVISNTIAFTFMKRKIHRLKDKYDLVNIYTNRLYHLYQMSIEDAKITVEEMEEFRSIVRDYGSEIREVLILAYLTYLNVSFSTKRIYALLCELSKTLTT